LENAGVNGFLKRLLRRIGVPTLLIATLLAAACAGLAFTLSAVVRGLDAELMFTMAFVGMVCGWALARTRLRAAFAGVMLAGIALVIAFVRVGQLGAPIVTLLCSLGETAWRAQLGQWQFSPLWQAVEPVGAAVWTMLLRVASWGGALLAGQSLYEPVAMALVWSSIVFGVAAFAAWRIRRAQRAFDALLPLILLLGAVIAYSGRNVWVMFVVLGVWFGLLVVVPYFARQKQWDQSAIPYADELWMDTTFVTVPVIMILITVAIGVPVISPDALARWVREWNQNTPASAQIISTSFGIEPAPPPQPPSALNRTSSPGLPRSHLLGASPDLLNRPALTIQSNDLTEAFPARYWLGTTYDEYTGRGWFSSGFRTQTYQPDERVLETPPPAHRLTRQSVRVENGSGLVYAAGIVQSMDQPFQVAWRQPDDIFGAQVNANAYQVAAYVTDADANALRAAGQVYSPWIGSQYLRLPSETPPRVIALARDLTATAVTPYDRARALENYLRMIPYSLDVPTPPTGRDVTDYFLFDLRRGYCDYYATAMAVLARAAGLPARIAVGYAAGEYDAGTQTYRVIEANAHSWTQIYFPEYGWVDFEPTSGRAVPGYETPLAVLPSAPLPPPHGAYSLWTTAQATAASHWLWLPIVLVALSVCVSLVAFADSLYLERVQENAVAQILYRRMFWYARQCGVPMTNGLTPRQICARLQAHFEIRQDSQTLTRVWRPIPPVLSNIVEQYERVTFGAHRLTKAQSAELVRQWQTARARLIPAFALDLFLRKISFRSSKSKQNRTLHDEPS
jgi:transglutaminase-like putative cysteine protease